MFSEGEGGNQGEEGAEWEKVRRELYTLMYMLRPHRFL